MSIYYFDTSALVKRYVAETGSLWVENILGEQSESGYHTHQALFSYIAIAETAAAIARRNREGKLDKEKQSILLKTFYKDIDSHYRLVELTEKVVFSAAGLTQIHPLRGYDAVHLASAIEVNNALRFNRLSPLVLVSADANLLQAAAVEGLRTDNPNNHV